MPYYVYLLLCQDGSYYCGYTTNPERRLFEHKYGLTKYTRGRGIVEMRVLKRCHDRSEAMRYEIGIKKMSHHTKVTLFNNATII